MHWRREVGHNGEVVRDLTWLDGDWQEGNAFSWPGRGRTPSGSAPPFSMGARRSRE